MFVPPPLHVPLRTPAICIPLIHPPATFLVYIPLLQLSSASTLRHPHRRSPSNIFLLYPPLNAYPILLLQLSPTFPVHIPLHSPRMTHFDILLLHPRHMFFFYMYMPLLTSSSTSPSYILLPHSPSSVILLSSSSAFFSNVPLHVSASCSSRLHLPS